MANRYSNDQYGSNDSGNNNGSDDFDNEDNDNLTLATNTAVNATIVEAFQFDKDWGTTLGVNLGDVELLDGILMTKRNDETKLKLFSWDEFGFERDEDGVAQVPEDEIPTSHKMSVGGTNHNYTRIGYAIEGAEGHDGEPALIGDVTVMLGNGSKGRTLAELILEDGEGSTGDGDAWNDDFGWLKDDSATVREDLKGREVELFYRKITYTDDDDEERSYDQATIVDAKTGENIRSPNQGGGDGSDDEETETATTSDSAELEDVFPDEGQPVLDIFLNNADTDGVPDEDEVRDMLGNQLDEVEQTDVDYVIQEVEAEVNGKVAA